MKAFLLLVLLVVPALVSSAPDAGRPRVRDFGLAIGTLPPGPLNAITDVAGVRVGHLTLVEGDAVRTGVTAILPHGGNVFREKVPAAIAVGNGFGKLTGVTQVQELGTLETPIVLTNTLSVPEAAAGVVEYVLSLPGNEDVLSVNPVVGETNDGALNDIRLRRVRPEHALAAIRGATDGPVEEGAVGAGTGTICFGFKGGIGTSSRRLPPGRGGWTVGVLVQTNFGGDLRVGGVPAGARLGPALPKEDAARAARGGSCMIVVATDAPLDARLLRRLAARALLGIARAGGIMANGSGDYAVAFSTDRRNRVLARSESPVETRAVLRDDDATPLFAAAAEASEEAILDSLFKAVRVEGRGGRVVEALPLDAVRAILADPRLLR